MMEAEWLTCSDPEPMLEFLRGKASERKLRLFACACCQRIESLLTAKGKQAVLTAQKFADGLIDHHELHAAWAAVGFPKKDYRQFAAAAARAASCSPNYDGTAHAAASAVNTVVHRSHPRERDASWVAERAAQSLLLRDIFGNSMRPGVVTPSCLTWNAGIVLKLAQAIYDERAFGRLPVLADALEEAGCANADILAHCRQPGEHVCGCWVVDLLLGKE